MAIVELNQENFDKVISESKVPVLVDFWAKWCGPCKMLTPILHSVDDEIGDKALIAKVNVDENMDLSMQYNIMSIPCLVLFKDGVETKRLVGLQSKETLLSFLKQD